MSDNDKKVDSILNLWDKLDNMILYMPLKRLKDKTHRVLVQQDDRQEGQHVLRVFTSKMDVNEYASNHTKEEVGFAKLSLDELEEYMERYSKRGIESSIKLTKCVLATIDIDKKIRDIEVLWSTTHT